MRVYHFVEEKFGLDDLRKQRLKVAVIADLNDPFELAGPPSSDRQVRARVRRWKDSMAKEYGLLCFSKSWRNPVQWSHYADKHRGLCLGFDVPNDRLLSVRYQQQRIELNIDDLESDDAKTAEAAKQRLISTKYSHWRYEAELRILLPLKQALHEDGRYFKLFDEDLVLKEIIVGCRSCVSDRMLNEELGLKSSPIVIRKARLAFRSFRVVNQL